MTISVVPDTDRSSAPTSPAPTSPAPSGAADLREEIRRVLSVAPTDEAARSRDPREVYRQLGRQGLLAPQWPTDLGGRGADHVAAAVLVEELVAHDVPELLHTLSVQVVGAVLLAAGDPDLAARYLPRLAAGELAACVLFSEPQAGSDLASLQTVARPAPGGRYVLSGTKCYSVFTRFADVGLCLARADGDRISLFLVDLHAPGVTVTRRAALADDDFHEVVLDAVDVGPQDVVGQPGQGWALLVRTLQYERTGLDYWSKALHWYELAVDRLHGAGSAEVLAGLGRLAGKLDAAHVLVRRTLTRLEAGTLDEAEAAAAKWLTAELAAEVAWWAFDQLGGEPRTLVGGDGLDSALREAPGVRISGGTSEMMLETVARLRLDVTREERS